MREFPFWAAPLSGNSLDRLRRVVMSCRNKIILILLTIPLFISYALGKCVNPEPVEKTIIIDACEVIDPYQVPELKDFAERYPKGFVESYQKEAEKRVRGVMESYVGAVLIDNQGSKIEKYFLPSKDRKVCETFKTGTSVRALVGFACCDGDSNAPCYLGFNPYVARILETDVK